MKKIVKRILIGLLVVLVILQFIRPDKNDSGYESVVIFEQETSPSTEVAGILKTNCYDCHSNQTEYPWYSHIAPISYWLQDHIKHGKGHFNVSEWSNYSAKKKDHKLEEVIEMVEKGDMPLNSYTWIHGDLEKEDQKLLLQWAALARLQYIKELELSVK